MLNPVHGFPTRSGRCAPPLMRLLDTRIGSGWPDWYVTKAPTFQPPITPSTNLFVSCANFCPCPNGNSYVAAITKRFGVSFADMLHSAARSFLSWTGPNFPNLLPSEEFAPRAEVANWCEYV